MTGRARVNRVRLAIYDLAWIVLPCGCHTRRFWRLRQWLADRLFEIGDDYQEDTR
jgi:hypothetical protein